MHNSGEINLPRCERHSWSNLAAAQSPDIPAEVPRSLRRSFSVHGLGIAPLTAAGLLRFECVRGGESQVRPDTQGLRIMADAGRGGEKT